MHVEKAKTANGTYYRAQTNLMAKNEAEEICRVVRDCLVVKSK